MWHRPNFSADSLVIELCPSPSTLQPADIIAALPIVSRVRRSSERLSESHLQTRKRVACNHNLEPSPSACNPTSSQVKITVHQPKLTSQTEHLQTTTLQTQSHDSTGSQINLQTKSDLQKESVGFAKPIHSTLLIIILAILLIVALFTYLYFRKKWRI